MYIYFLLSLHFHALSMSEFTFDIMDHGSLRTAINLQPLLLTNARGQTFDGKVCEYTTFIQLSLKHLLCSGQWFESSQWCWRPEPGCFYKSKKYHPKISPPCPEKKIDKNQQVWWCWPEKESVVTNNLQHSKWWAYHPHMFMESLHGHTACALL